MSIIETLPVPIVQMGLVEKVAEHLENHPVVQQQVLQTEAERILREQNTQVPKAEGPEKPQGRRVGERGEDPSGKRGRGHKEQPPSDKQEKEEQPAANPWSGNILNLKV